MTRDPCAPSTDLQDEREGLRSLSHSFDRAGDLRCDSASFRSLFRIHDDQKVTRAFNWITRAPRVFVKVPNLALLMSVEKLVKFVWLKKLNASIRI